ncbi:class I SAM-dependent methyltransferase [Aeromicrobium halocynthiae]|uniref:Class I SAM-dependent methyltransferase n=1 Tax=Aeromicrobium halocynthiae TaxID=560557 RepID=A0ABN2W2N5_9ACTN
MDEQNGAEHARPTMVITGERTVPGIWHENYWFRRHEVVYEWVASRVTGLEVLEAGCGEGYGADLLARHAAGVVALDYDAYATGHARSAYPDVPVVRGNLVALPLADRSVDAVVSLQTVEHLWDQPTFVAECVRVLRPGGLLVISTPNTLTFPPGNIYHPRELEPHELEALVDPVADVAAHLGLRHGPRLRAWEDQHGSIVDAQVAGTPDTWSPATCAMVRDVTTADFELLEDGLEESLDLVLAARRSPETSVSDR